MHWSTLLVVVAFAMNASGSYAFEQPFPPPDLNASTRCSASELEKAVASSRVVEPVLDCFRIHRYVFEGFGLVVQPSAATVPESFHALKRAVFRDQSARLRTERDLAEALPDSPPAHGTIPTSLYIGNQTPLGVFTEGPRHIGFADLVPSRTHQNSISSTKRYPTLQMETYVSHNGDVFRLIVTSQVGGPETIARGYALAEDWALAVAVAGRP